MSPVLGLLRFELDAVMSARLEPDVLAIAQSFPLRDEQGKPLQRVEGHARESPV